MNIAQRNSARTEIARKVRALRAERRLTQGELSKDLGLSQGRFSEIERGQGSFSAEQFLELLRLFNVPVSHFAPEGKEFVSEIQNALARLGASHLHERSDVLPSDLLEEVGDVVREVLVGAEFPRHITSLAPVLVRNIDSINLTKLRIQFLEYGLERRWVWLLENTLEAILHELSEGLSRKQSALYRRAQLVLTAHIDSANSDRLSTRIDQALDILDTNILSRKTLQEVQNDSSPISQRLGIVTNIQPDDFIQALKASRVAH